MKLAEIENIQLESDASILIARLAQGGMRDAISMMELCAGKTGIVTVQSVYDAAGLCGRQTVEDIIMAVQKRDYASLLTLISSMYRSAVDLSVLLSDIMQYYRDMMIKKTLALKQLDPASKEILDLSDAEFSKMCTISDAFRRETILHHMKQLEGAYLSMSRGADKRITLETVLMRISAGIYDDSPEALADRISALETKLVEVAAGSFSPKQQETVVNNEEIKPEISVEKEEIIEAPVIVDKPTESKFGDWAEIVSKYDEIDGSVSPFLRAAQAFMSGSVLCVKVSDSFQKSMLEMADAPSKIRALMLSENYSVSEVKLVVADIKSETSDLDDL